MRRISLALALVGAVAATGCGGGAKPASNGGTKGTAGVNFTVTLNNQGPGTVASSVSPVSGDPAPCAAGTTCKWTFASGTTVTLTATAATGNFFNGWFGGCSGTGTCTLSGDADKYVVSLFASTVLAHPNWAPGAVHGEQYSLFKSVAGYQYQCTQCHGQNLQGQGLAPSCSLCHPAPGQAADPNWAQNIVPSQQVGHFNPAKAAWTDHGTGWAQDCQRCHTDQGFRDFIGQLAAPGEATPSDDHLGGSIVGTTYTAGKSTNTATTNVGAAAPTATQYAYGPLKCFTCHNPVSDPTSATSTLATVKFPSQKTVTTDKATTVCAQCHQAREGTATIEARIAAKAPATADTKVTGFGFANPHYLGAAATLFGEEAAGWVQYTGNSYTGRNEHGGAASCTVCHDAHTGELPSDGIAIQTKCGACHFNETTGLPVQTFLELEDSRQFGFEGDIDGNGVQEGVKVEIDGLAAKLYAAIQAYATNVLAAPITYTDAYPYYMGADGKSYTTFSARLQRAAVNYKWYKAEPGAWAHNPRYAIEVIYDSIADLNVALAPLGKQVPNGKRAFNGHFGAAEDPSPYAAMIYHGASNAVTGEVLPTMGFTSAACYQCHGGNVGFGAYLAGAPAAMPAAMTTNDAAKVTAMQCATCHTLTGTDMKTIRSDVANVYFPPQKGATPAAGQNVVVFAAANLPPGFAVCATCHSGRENGGSINIKIGATADTSFTITSFTNPHYLGAAGMMLGSSAGMMYQYAGKSYTTTPAFWSLGANGPHGSPHGAKCAGCHNPQGTAHTFEIDLDKTIVNGTFYGAQNTKACSECHAGGYSLAPKITEFEDAAAELYAAIQAYATANAPAQICYTAATNPYFFKQVNTTDACGTGANNVSYNAFNPKLLKAAFNYQWTQKEPGAWAHNEFYVMQVIYDSIVDLGGTPSFTVAASTTDATLNRP